MLANLHITGRFQQRSDGLMMNTIMNRVMATTSMIDTWPDAAATWRADFLGGPVN